MRLGTTDIAILLILGTLLITRSIWGLMKDTNIDISKSNTLVGRVTQADIRSIKEATFKLTKYKTVFIIELDNSDEIFAVDRGINTCNFLLSKIKKDDWIKVFYRSSTGDYNTHIFQIEKNNAIVINSKDYSKNELQMIILMAFFGGCLTAGAITAMIKQK